MVKDRIAIQRATVELPRDLEGLKAVLDGLQELYPDGEGHGPGILRNIRHGIERAQGNPEEIQALKETFDSKISELMLRDIDRFPDKKARFSRGMNEADAQTMERILRAGTSLDISAMPFFSEENKKALEVKAEQKLWEKGLVGRVPQGGE